MNSTLQILSHEELVKMVEGLDVIDLTNETFDKFAMFVKAYFNPEDSEFINYFRVGNNSESRRNFNWSEGQPEWRNLTKPYRLDKLYERGRSFLKSIELWFDRTHEKFHGRLDIKFSYNPDIGLYLRDEVKNGTLEFPREDLFVRIPNI
ncbi:hypothetical protein GOV12_00970 [Candidatus Pacearchaeota archaeon]|nr:hypothetical protein [Candidatus Pacearchaeota archaeon]